MIKKMARRLPFVFLGAFLFALGLEGFIVPNKIIDGGVVGVSLMVSHVWDLNFSITLVLLSIPFLWIGYKQIGGKFTLFTTIGIIAGSTFSSLLHDITPFTQDMLLSSVFGAILLGVGVGLVMRNGGCLDGTEIIAILLNKKSPFSVGEIVLVINLFVFTIAGFVYGWEQAMYSIITYYMAAKVIDLTVAGLSEMKEVWVISEQHDTIKQAFSEQLGRNVTYLNGRGGYTADEKCILVCYITRLEESSLKEIVYDIDKNALVKISNVSELIGGQFKKESIH